MTPKLLEKLADEYIKYLKIRLFIRSDPRWLMADNHYETRQYYKHYSMAKYEATCKTLEIMGFVMDKIDENKGLEEMTYIIKYNDEVIDSYHHIPRSEIEFGYNPCDMLIDRID